MLVTAVQQINYTRPTEGQSDGRLTTSFKSYISNTKKKLSFREFVILQYKLQMFAHQSALDTDICVPVDELTRKTTDMKNVPRSVRKTVFLMRATLHGTVVSIRYDIFNCNWVATRWQ